MKQNGFSCTTWFSTMGCGASKGLRVTPAQDGTRLIVDLAPYARADGATLDGDMLRSAIASSHGLAASIRQHCWPRLLGVCPWSANDAQVRQSNEVEFSELLLSARRRDSIDPGQARVVEVDVPRTDRSLPAWRDNSSLQPLHDLLIAHLAHAPHPGYYQGMNDVAAVLLHSLGDLPLAFWCFEGFLRSTSANWEPAELAGVWAQASAISSLIAAVDPQLAAHLSAASPSAELHPCPMPWLFQLIILRLKREMADYEEVRNARVAPAPRAAPQALLAWPVPPARSLGSRSCLCAGVPPLGGKLGCRGSL